MKRFVSTAAGGVLVATLLFFPASAAAQGSDNGSASAPGEGSLNAGSLNTDSLGNSGSANASENGIAPADVGLAMILGSTVVTSTVANSPLLALAAIMGSVPLGSIQGAS